MATQKQLMRVVEWAGKAPRPMRRVARGAVTRGFRSAWLPLDKNLGRRLEQEVRREARRR